MVKAFTSRVLIVLIGAMVAFAVSAQQAYPNKVIRFITPAPPGGTMTFLARLIAQRLTENWGQQVIVDHRPGGNFIIGTEALARSAPDGYTIMLMANLHVTLPYLYKSMPYDSFRDFAQVATVTSNELVLVVHNTLPANSLREFIALAKSRPGQLNSASAGSGGFTHLSIELFNTMTGTTLQHVPYKGSALALTDLIGGQVQLAFTPVNNALPHIKSGRLKAMAISGKSRAAVLSQVPTFTEAGLPDFDVGNWYGVLAPAGTPRAIIDKLSVEINKLLAEHETKEKLDTQGMDPYISSPEHMLARMQADSRRFGDVIRNSNIKLEN